MLEDCLLNQSLIINIVFSYFEKYLKNTVTLRKIWFLIGETFRKVNVKGNIPLVVM